MKTTGQRKWKYRTGLCVFGCVFVFFFFFHFSYSNEWTSAYMSCVSGQFVWLNCLCVCVCVFFVIHKICKKEIKNEANKTKFSQFFFLVFKCIFFFLGVIILYQISLVFDGFFCPSKLQFNCWNKFSWNKKRKKNKQIKKITQWKWEIYSVVFGIFVG